MGQSSERVEQRAAARPAVRWLVQVGGGRACTTGLALLVTIMAGLLASCATAPATREDKAALVAAAASRSNLDTVSFTYMRSAADCVLTTSQSVPACPRSDKDRLV